VKKAVLLSIRSMFILALALSAGFLVAHFGQRTPWFKQHLYRQLVAGDAEKKLQAASLLAEVGGERQLLKALQSESEEISTTARRALEHSWFSAAGNHAYTLMESAYKAADERRYEEALKQLDGIIAQYPDFAEALNRRASVLWQLGEFKKSLADCERAVALNPNHFGAWQGLGVCHLQLGDFAAACRSLRTALKIDPHDVTARRCLQRCEDLLRVSPSGRRATQPAELL